jgi:hypothetical protein
VAEENVTIQYHQLLLLLKIVLDGDGNWLNLCLQSGLE